MPDTSRSICAASIGRLRQAMAIERAQLVAVERLRGGLALDHGQLAQLDAFEGGEARARTPRTAAAAGSPRRPRSGGCPSPGCLHGRRTGSACVIFCS